MLKEKTRFELKYQLSIFDYYRIKNRLLCFVDHDKYSLASTNKKYYVQSLYYDTYDYKAFVEKMTGESNRIKLRIRSYFQSPDEAKFVSVEIKSRITDKVLKHSTQVSYQEYAHFQKHRHWQNQKDPVLCEFVRLIKLKDLRPKVLVEYEREAFYVKGDRDIRITFDHNVRSSQAQSLYPKSMFSRRKDPNLVVLEIKAQMDRPIWLEEIIRTYELKSVPNSKYSQGIEQTQHAVFI